MRIVHVLASLLVTLLAPALVCPSAPGQDKVVWKGPAVSDWRDAEWLQVHGVMENGAFRATGVEAAHDGDGHARPLLPLTANLLPAAQVRVFGVEERVKISVVGGRLAVTCRPGKAPAGLTIGWPDHRPPLGFRGHWTVTGNSDAPIGIAAVEEGHDALADMTISWVGGAVTIPLSARPAERTLAFICSANGGSAQIDNLVLEPWDGRENAYPRGTWIWEEQAWNADPIGFARAAADAGWTELAVQIPAVPSAALASLARALKERGIALRLLDGDPDMATPEGLRHALPRIKQIRQWCQDHMGVPMLELDIEPYGSAAFGTDPAKGWRGWAAAIKAVAAVWGEPVAVDLPWWMRRSPGGEGALKDARASISEVVVMAYRTDLQLILDAVEPWLADPRQVARVAIEVGPVPPEVTRLYRRSARGTLRVSDAATLILDSERRANIREAIFKQVQESVTHPSRVSFHAFPDEAAGVERALSRLLAAWPSFAGFRIHGWSLPTGR